MFSGSFGVLSLGLRHRFIMLRFQAFSSASTHTSSSRDSNSSKKELLKTEEAAARAEAYRQLENLDFKSAAKILFTTPPNRKKFGLDFHLVQLFFACLPSLAVYLVAQYARSEIRRMEAEAEQKKKQAEEKHKVKDAELTPTKELSNTELSEVKIRLDALEEAVKVIVDEKRKNIDSEPNSNRKAKNEKVEPTDKNSEKQIEAKEFKGSSTNITHNSKIQNKDADIAGASDGYAEPGLINAGYHDKIYCSVVIKVENLLSSQFAAEQCQKRAQVSSKATEQQIEDELNFIEYG